MVLSPGLSSEVSDREVSMASLIRASTFEVRSAHPDGVQGRQARFSLQREFAGGRHGGSDPTAVVRAVRSKSSQRSVYAVAPPNALPRQCVRRHDAPAFRRFNESYRRMRSPQCTGLDNQREQAQFHGELILIPARLWRLSFRGKP